MIIAGADHHHHHHHHDHYYIRYIYIHIPYDIDLAFRAMTRLSRWTGHALEEGGRCFCRCIARGHSELEATEEGW